MKLIPSERHEQITLHKWCKAKRLLSFSVPNGGSRHRLEAINLKKEGATAGVSDYVVMLPTKILFIELKRKAKVLKSGKLSVSHTRVSDEQKSFTSAVNEFKYSEARICYGASEAIKFIESHLPKSENDKQSSIFDIEGVK